MSARAGKKYYAAGVPFVEAKDSGCFVCGDTEEVSRFLDYLLLVLL